MREIGTFCVLCMKRFAIGYIRKNNIVTPICKYCKKKEEEKTGVK